MTRSRSGASAERPERSRKARQEPEGRKPRVRHRERQELPRRLPLHVTSRFEAGLPSARREDLFRIIRGAFCDKRIREGFRLVQFSVQADHLHLVVEADDRERLARGMQSVLITIAKRLNQWWGRKGRVIEHRYHARQLRTAREVRHVLAHVLCNARRHGVAVSADAPDDRSSGRWFDGWLGRRAEALRPGAPVAIARTWLLAWGWRRAGLIPVDHVPGSG